MDFAERAAQLLRMAAALEENIIRFENRLAHDTDDTVRRLRRLQDDILTAVSHLEDESSPRSKSRDGLPTGDHPT